jgi:hypothetical protein
MNDHSPVCKAPEISKTVPAPWGWEVSRPRADAARVLSALGVPGLTYAAGRGATGLPPTAGRSNPSATARGCISLPPLPADGGETSIAAQSYIQRYRKPEVFQVPETQTDCPEKGRA